jgi:transposase InsO family protein
MSSSASSPAPTTATTSRHPKRIWAPSYKLDRLPKLTGPENYQQWREASEHVLQVFGCWDIVNGTEEQPKDKFDKDGNLENEDEIEGFKDRYQYTSAFYLETIDPTWLTVLTTYRTPSAIWKALQDKFARENTTSFYNHLSGLLNLRMESKSKATEHLTQFDSNWNRLQHRCSTAKESDTFKLPHAFKSVFDSLEAKAALLLYTLPPSMENIVDNLQTKEGLTYDQVYQKLMNLSTSDKHDEDKAYKATEKKRKSNYSADRDTKECTYCKKHYPNSKSIGHTWNECHKLKADKEKKSDKGKEKVDETAKITTEASSSSLETVGLHSSADSFPTSSTPPSTRWVLDTAASSHMTNNLDLFINIKHRRGKVRMGDDSVIESYGIGTVELLSKLPTGYANSSGTPHLVLRDVLYIPKLGQSNLLSWRAISHVPGSSFFLDGHGPDIFVRKEAKDGRIIIWGHLDGPDYVVQQEDLHVARLSTYMDWHKAFGHVSSKYINPSCYTDGHLLPKQPLIFECDQCALSKSTKQKPLTSSSHAKRPFELIHSDLSGRWSQPSFGKSEYYITFVDDYSKYTWVKFLRQKSDATKAIHDFVSEHDRQGQNILRFRTDNGGEYVNKELEGFFQSKGIIHELTPAYSHESNGVAERYNRTIVTMVRGMINELPLALWSEAINTAVYIKNRIPHKAVKESTPYEVIHGNKPSIHHLQPFGRKCFVHIPEEKRPSGSKLLPRAVEGKFIGYHSTSNRIFRIYIPSQHRVTETRQVRFSQLDSGEVTPTTITKSNSEYASIPAPPPLPDPKPRTSG